MRKLACVAILLVTTAAFGGITRETITSGGKTRVYYLFIPKRAADAPPAPLLLTFHGSGTTARASSSRGNRSPIKRGSS